MRTEQIEKIKGEFQTGIEKEMLFEHMNAEYLKACRKRTFWADPTKEKWEEERKKLRKIFMEIFSPFPERCPLSPKTTAVWQREGYRMECVCFYSSPKVIVTANLYVPDSAVEGKTPALVVACGHSKDSKSYYRGVAEAACKAGMLVLCFDPTGQGERYEAWDYMRWQQRALIEHDRLGALALLMGGNLAGVFAWDCMRAIDYIESRPETDRQKIGFMGTSGGGMQTTWAATLDERVAVAIPSCFITSIEHLLTSREPNDCEQNPPGMLEEGLEYRDFLAMMAPKPILVLGTEEDFFPIEGAKETVADLKRLYADYGVEEKVEIYVAPGGHAGRGMMATKGVSWLCRWFGLPVPEYSDEEVVLAEEALKKTADVDEDTFAAEGQLLLKPEINGYWKYYRGLIRELDAVFHKDELCRRLSVNPEETGAQDGLEVRFCWTEADMQGRWNGDSNGVYKGGILKTEEDISVPWIYACASEQPSEKLCVLSHEDGMTCLFGNGREASLLLKAGVDVLVFDPRGVGTTRGGSYGWWASWARRFLKPMVEEGVLNDHTLGYVDPTYEGTYATGHELGMHGIKLNRPVLGQRVTDALHILGQIRRLTGTDYGKVYVYGAGYSAAWMLYAALLTECRVEACVFHGILASYKLLAEMPEHRYSIEHLARGLLLTGDIPQALEALPCEVLVIDPTDSMRLPVDERIGADILRGSKIRQIYTRGDVNPLYEVVDYIK